MAKINLGEVLKNVIADKNLTVDQIVKDSRLPQASIERYIAGEGTPTLTKFLKLANGVGVEASELFLLALEK